MIENDNIQEQVLKFLSINLLIPIEKINLSDSFFHDLGVAGDDGVDLINGYAKKFNVSLNGFNFNKYFGNESSSIIGIIYELVTKKSFKAIPKLTVRDLVEAAKSGKLE